MSAFIALEGANFCSAFRADASVVHHKLGALEMTEKTQSEI